MVSPRLALAAGVRLGLRLEVGLRLRVEDGREKGGGGVGRRPEPGRAVAAAEAERGWAAGGLRVGKR